MKILVILKGSLSKLPPIITTCLSLSELNHSVTVFTQSSSDYIENIFREKNISIVYYKETKMSTKIKLISKICTWLNFRKQVREYISKNKFDFFWIGSADTALAIGKKLLNFKYVFHVHELYDTVPYYRRNLKIYMQKALKILVPEEIRAHIFRAWYQLKETPIVLPNKPYYHPRKRNLEITDKTAKEAFEKIPKGSKIVFYQGGLSEKRDLKTIAKAIEEMGTPWCLAVQCPITKNAYYEDFFKNYKFYYIPYVKAPKHLEITSNVDIGLVSYSHISLNNEFCAPNKIWEYAGFGLPIIANDVFGLKEFSYKFKFGVCLNFNKTTKDDFKKILYELDNNSELYSRDSKLLYESIDITKTIMEVISTVKC
ncbi:MAG: hypothetical protein J6T23_06860 [Elusimicrobia bacterium]|nr:hypothetical protein [Elusimicrobiota bacterium]